MKKLLWVLAALVVIVGAALAFAVYRATSLAERFKPDIEHAASDALHASVSLGNISVSLFPSVKLRVEEARIAQPGSTEGLSLKGLVLHVKLLPLLSRRVVIETISLDEPIITVVKTKAGTFLEGLPRPHPAQRPPPPAVAAPSVPPPPAVAPPSAVPPAAETRAAPAASRFSVDLRRFEVSDATFTLRDTEQNKELSVKHINLTTAVSMVGDTANVSSLALRGDLPNGEQVSVSGPKQSFNLRTGQLTLGDLEASLPGGVVTLTGAVNVNAASGDLTVSSDGINLDQVLPLAAAFAPAASGLKLGGIMKPDIKAAFGTGAYSASGNVTLQDVSFQRGTLSLSGISGPLVLTADNSKQCVAADGLPFVLDDKPGKITFSAVVQGDNFRIDPLALSVLSGSLSGTVESSLAPPNRFGVRLDGSGFSVAELMALAAPRARVRMEGVVSRLALDVRGEAQGNVAQSLDGTAGVGMKHGVLKGFNLAAAVLTAAKRTPLLAGAVEAPRFQKYLSSKDTAIDSLTGDFTIRSGGAETRNLRLESDPFTLTGSGSVSFESDVNLDATITFDRETSQLMIGKAKELRAVLNDDGTLTIPLTITGRAPKFEVRPDVERLIEAGTKNVLQGKVGKVLEKALRGDEKEGGKLLDRLFGK